MFIFAVIDLPSPKYLRFLAQTLGKYFWHGYKYFLKRKIQNSKPSLNGRPLNPVHFGQKMDFCKILDVQICSNRPAISKIFEILSSNVVKILLTWFWMKLKQEFTWYWAVKKLWPLELGPFHHNGGQNRGEKDQNLILRCALTVFDLGVVSVVFWGP